MTDHIAKQAHDIADDTATKAADIAEDAAEKATDIAGDSAERVQNVAAHASKTATDHAEHATEKASDLAGDAAKTATGFAEEITGQVRHAVGNTVNDIDLDKAAETVVAVAREAVDKVTTAYKRNPALVLTLGSVALAALTAIGALATRRR